jgi:diguanylate cyclase (GGDEF)-like protein
MRVDELISSPVHTISPEKSVFRAAELMNEHGVDTLVVVDYGAVVGILTSRDVRSAHPNRIVADAMTPDPVTVSPDIFIWDALSIMDRHRIGRLLIRDGNKLAGLVTREAIRIRLSELLDPLTGLYREPYIRAIGEALLKKKQPFHLLFIDLNSFREINKRYGHPFGDDAILAFSRRMARWVKEKRDYICRYGGDEFVIISLAEEETVDRFIRAISRPLSINRVAVSASIGYVNGHREPRFFAMSMRDVLAKASLLSTGAKTAGKSESGEAGSFSSV